MSHRHELIQVAAVAVAALENEKFGQANAQALVFSEDGSDLEGMQAWMVSDEVIEERQAQDAKWGEQRHSRVVWAMILAEEIGEWAEEITKADIDDGLGEDSEEAYLATDVLTELAAAGRLARVWLQDHEWAEDEQQAIYDEERSAG